MLSRLSVSALSLLLSLTAWGEDPASAPQDEAAPPTSTAPRAPLLERNVQTALELARKYPQQARELQAGEERFLALHQLANTARTKGLIVILPADGETADWPRVVAPLRSRLPDNGWQTLSLSLPSPDHLLPAGPSATTADEPADGASAADEASTDEPPEDLPAAAGYLPEETAALPTEADAPVTENETKPAAASLDQAARITAHLEAALAFARMQQVDTIVLLGHGSGAYWAARYLHEHTPQDVKHLILLQAQVPESEDADMAPLLGELKQAIGDFYYPDKPATIEDARERLNVSRRQRHPAYQQIALQALPADRRSEQEQLYRRVRGWLDRQFAP